MRYAAAVAGTGIDASALSMPRSPPPCSGGWAPEHGGHIIPSPSCARCPRRAARRCQTPSGGQQRPAKLGPLQNAPQCFERTAASSHRALDATWRSGKAQWQSVSSRSASPPLASRAAGTSAPRWGTLLRGQTTDEDKDTGLIPAQCRDPRLVAHLQHIRQHIPPFHRAALRVVRDMNTVPFMACCANSAPLLCSP